MLEQQQQRRRAVITIIMMAPYKRATRHRNGTIEKRKKATTNNTRNLVYTHRWTLQTPEWTNNNNKCWRKSRIKTKSKRRKFTFLLSAAFGRCGFGRNQRSMPFGVTAIVFISRAAQRAQWFRHAWAWFFVWTLFCARSSSPPSSSSSSQMSSCIREYVIWIIIERRKLNERMQNPLENNNKQKAKETLTHSHPQGASVRRAQRTYQ